MSTNLHQLDDRQDAVVTVNRAQRTYRRVRLIGNAIAISLYRLVGERLGVGVAVANGGATGGPPPGDALAVCPKFARQMP
jgi:hypothetical protein